MTVGEVLMSRNWKISPPSLSTFIIIGLLLGIVCGLFFGDYCAFLKIFGDAFIKLLQMSILPYIVVSLIAGIGSLSFKEAKLIGIKGGTLLLLFWAIGFAVILIIAGLSQSGIRLFFQHQPGRGKRRSRFS